MVAVSPAVDRTLDQAALLAQVGIQLCQRPTNCVTLALVVQAIALVLLLPATGAWIDAVCRLELGAQLVDIDRLHIASNRVFHLHTVARVLESNPLDSIVVLAYNERGRGRDWTWCCA